MEVRLNSPRDKFKITNMADDQVDLTPEDIPGASFIETDRFSTKVLVKMPLINQNGNERELLES